MTYLVSLSLINFKSYARAEINFTRAINLIAGANGSGKSNILDALLFVLGGEISSTIRASSLKSLMREDYMGDDNDSAFSTRVVATFSEGTTIQATIVASPTSGALTTVFLLKGKKVSRKQVRQWSESMGISAQAYDDWFISQNKITRIPFSSAHELAEKLVVSAGVSGLLQNFQQCVAEQKRWSETRPLILINIEKLEKKIMAAKAELRADEQQLLLLEKIEETDRQIKAIQYRDLEQAISEKVDLLVRYEAKAELAKEQLEIARKDLATKSKEKRQYDDEYHKLTTMVLPNAQQKAIECEVRVAKLLEKHRAAKSDLEEFSQESQTAQQRAEQLEKQLASLRIAKVGNPLSNLQLRSRKELLKKLQSKLMLKKSEPPRLYQVLRFALAQAKPWRKALEELLRPSLNVLLVQTASEGTKVLKAQKSTHKRCTIWVMDQIPLIGVNTTFPDGLVSPLTLLRPCNAEWMPAIFKACGRGTTLFAATSQLAKDALSSSIRTVITAVGNRVSRGRLVGGARRSGDSTRVLQLVREQQQRESLQAEIQAAACDYSRDELERITAEVEVALERCQEPSEASKIHQMKTNLQKIVKKLDVARAELSEARLVAKETKAREKHLMEQQIDVESEQQKISDASSEKERLTSAIIEIQSDLTEMKATLSSFNHAAESCTPSAKSLEQLEQELNACEAELDMLKTTKRKRIKIDPILLRERERELAELRTHLESVDKGHEALSRGLQQARALAAVANEEAFRSVSARTSKLYNALVPLRPVSLLKTHDEDPSKGIRFALDEDGSSLEHLSGGQRSLLALAFVVALSEQRPRPFIVLDEVDAALDALFVEQAMKMIRCLAVQVICISHRQTSGAPSDNNLLVEKQEGISSVSAQ